MCCVAKFFILPQFSRFLLFGKKDEDLLPLLAGAMTFSPHKEYLEPVQCMAVACLYRANNNIRDLVGGDIPCHKSIR